MNTYIDGTKVESATRGLVLKRGQRVVHLLGTSVEQTEKAHRIIAKNSFNKIYTAAKSSPIKNTRFIKL